MNALAEFHFLRPVWLAALGLLPLFGWIWHRARIQAGSWRSVVDAHLLPHLIEAGGEPTRRGSIWLAAAIWVVACAALAGPAWEREPLPLYRNDAARVLAIELAPTMLAADVKPTRLARAQFKLNDILSVSRDMQTALIGYSGDAFVAAPLTDDVNTVRNLIGALDPGVMPVVGNNAGRAIEVASSLIEQAGLKHGELILLADSVSDHAIDSARAAHARGLAISVLGVGSNNGAPVPLPQGGFLQDAKGNIVLPRLDEVRLRALAAAGGGRFAVLTADRTDLDFLLGTHDASPEASRAQGNSVLSERYLDRGPWVLLILVPLAMFAFRRGWLMVFAIALLGPAPPVQAMGWKDLWLRADQQAANALAEGDVERAQALAVDPQWRGSAAYRAGDFAAASDAFAKAAGAEALYNRGNALAREGKYEEAIDAYRQSLAANPGMEDAQANKRAVEEWLKRQQQQKQTQQQDAADNAQQQPESSSDPGNGKQSQDADKNGKGKTGDQQSDERSPAEEQSPNDPSADSATDSQGKPKEGSNEPDEPAKNADGLPVEGKQHGEAEAEADKQQRQQQQLSQAIDKALDDTSQDAQAPVATGEPMNEAEREQRQALNQWLQRVPDDPGGLLRRKFQLEYDRRQREGGSE